MTTATLEHTNTRLLASAVGAAVALGIVLIALMNHGHAAFNTSSSGILWGLPIITYDYLLLTSAGIAAVASLALVFGVRDFYAVAKRCIWLAIACMLGGVMVLMLELGHPLRALYAIPFNFQYRSPLFWKVIFVSFYALLLFGVLLAMQRPGWDRRSARGLSLLMLLALLGVALVAGSVYGMMAMRPFWFGGEIPLISLVEAVLGGFAFITFFTYLSHGFSQAAMPAPVRDLFTGILPRIFAGLLVLYLAFILARAATGLWSNADGLEVWDYLVRSPLYYLELGVGLILPLLLLVSPLRSQGGVQIIVSFLVIVALFIGRYEYVIGGQLVPTFKGSWVHGMISYSPSGTEWMLLLAAVLVVNAVYAFGERQFDLGAQPLNRE
ncbi:MAG: NrfD/PsrC family molybdoenzyme membrane anchor subunit [Gammaproteobacteria bacterium]